MPLVVFDLWHLWINSCFT